MIFLDNLAGIEACLGSTIKAFSDFGINAELPRLGRPPATLESANGEVMGATRRTELESVMPDTRGKVGTKPGKVNVPDDAPEDTDETLATQETAVDPEEL